MIDIKSPNVLMEYQEILTFDELVNILGVGINTTYDLLKNKKIHSKIIGRGYRIPKLCVIDYIHNVETDKSTMFKEYKDLLDFKDIRQMLRKPSEHILYRILKNNEIFCIRIANEYKIPKTSLIEFILKD